MERRKMKVYYGRGRDYRRLPQIILKGLWLERMGFSVGDRLMVDCQPDGWLSLENRQGRKMGYEKVCVSQS